MSQPCLPLLSELTLSSFIFLSYVASSKRISLITLSKIFLSWEKMEPGVVEGKGDGILNRLSREGLIQKPAQRLSQDRASLVWQQQRKWSWSIFHLLLTEYLYGTGMK